MYIVIWEIRSSNDYLVKSGKAWEKFDSKKEADDRVAHLQKTNSESGIFNLSKIEALEVK